MNGETQSQIHKFIFNLGNQNLAKANANLKSILEAKIQERFKKAEKALKKTLN